MKKAFTLLELLVVIVVIAILSTVIILKTQDSLDKANLMQLKSEVATIQNGINQFQSLSTLKSQSNSYPDTLDNALSNSLGEKLFTNVIEYPIIATSQIEKKVGKWVKIDATQYDYFVLKDIAITFTYDNQTGTFQCDRDENLCQGLY